MQALVTVTLLNYNDRRTIFDAIASVVNSRYPSLELILIDNASADGTPDEIERRIPEWTEQRRSALQRYSLQRYSVTAALQPNWFRFIRNKENVGFARGHNQAIRQARGDFILCLNSDALLTAEFVEEALKPFADSRVGAIQGKLLRYDFESHTPKYHEGKPVIDTAGLLMFRNRRIVNRGQGEPDTGQYDRKEEVFGPDGAVPVYRKSALDDVAVPILNPKSQAPNSKQIPNSKSEIPNSDMRHAIGDKPTVEYFDEDFFLYKEDVDLAWRLRLFGWKTIFTPKAVAYHGRGAGDTMATNFHTIIRERKQISPRAKFYSFRNQRLMQLKDELPGMLARDFFPWGLKELAAWAYAILFEGLTVPRSIRDWAVLFPKILKKRSWIMAHRRISQKDMARWFLPSGAFYTPWNLPDTKSKFPNPNDQ